jgi:hypothetical protein
MFLLIALSPEKAEDKLNKKEAAVLTALSIPGMFLGGMR